MVLQPQYCRNNIGLGRTFLCLKPSVSFYTCTLHYFQNVVGLSEFIICALDTTPCIFSKTVFDFFFGVFRLSLHTSVHFVQPMYNSICQFRPTYLCCTTKTFWDSLLRSRAFIKLETLVCKYSVYFRDPRRNAPRIFCC